MYKLLSIIVVGAVLLTVATAAAAQRVCSDREEVVKGLESKYQETPVAIGTTPTGGLVELLTTKDGLTWTIIVSVPMPGGKVVTCLVASGEGWRSLAPIITDPEA